MKNFFRSPWRVSIVSMICSLLVFSVPSLVHAQKKSIKQYVHDIFTTKNGLPQNSAGDMIQTKDGYLWFATQEGLARFDGLRFTVFDRLNTEGLTDSWIFRIIEDSTGAIWIRTAGSQPGVTKYKDGTFTQYTTANGFPSNTPNSWEVDKVGGIWFGSPRGLISHSNGKFSSYTRQHGLPSDTVFAMTVDSKQNTWISTNGGLAILRNGKIHVLTGTKAFPDTIYRRVHNFNNVFEDSRGTMWLATPKGVWSYTDGVSHLYTTKNGLPNARINDVYEDAQGTIWFATAAGLASFKRGQFRTFIASNDVDENTLIEICADHEGSLWIATGKGIKRFSNGTFESFKKQDGLSDDLVQRMLVDKEGSVWAGTFGGGIDRFRAGKFITYSSSTGLTFDNMQPVFRDRHGALWMGSSSAGLNSLKDGKVTSYTSANGLPGNDVRDLGEDKEGNLWIATTRGLVSFNNGKFTPRSKKVGNDALPRGNAMALLKSGEFIIASDNTALKVRGDQFVPLFKIDSTTNNGNFIFDIWEDRGSKLWVTTTTRLYWFDGGKLEVVGRNKGFDDHWVQSFYEDRDGVVWLGVSGNGIWRYKDGKFSGITPKQGLFDFNAYTVMEDDGGYLWSSTNKGIFRVSKQEMNDVADGKLSLVHCTSFGEADGMETRECNGGFTPSATKLDDGRMAFATVKGVVIVNPADIRINPVPPPVIIERFVVEGVPQTLGSAAVLSPGKQRFEFNYAGLSYIGGDKVRFKYKLEGYDNVWIDAGTRRDAYYNNLAPGDYTFRVIAANSDGIWNERGATASFTLQPHFYQTTWFIVLVVFFFLTSGPSFYFYQMKSIKERKAELEKVVQERTAELQKTLENLKEMQHQLILSEKMASLGQLTAGIAHEIKNPLNFITNFAVLSQDLTNELKQELAAEKDRVDPKRAAEINEILTNLEQNVMKINEHGKRADSIVRGMLLHSRGKAGERQQTDLNALLGEYTNLAYHGMRAQDQSFNVKIETEFDPAIGKVSVVPQDLSRAFLNIVNNACYAANDKGKNTQNGFSPVVRVSAKNLGSKVEIRIRDNGNGVPKEVVDRIFNPFFTTKPAGVGTGLGLSLTYDIIVQEHKGEIRLDTKEGEFAEFIITIPKEQQKEEGAA